MVEVKLSIRSPDGMDVDHMSPNSYDEDDAKKLQALGKGGVHWYRCGGQGHIAEGPEEKEVKVQVLRPWRTKGIGEINGCDIAALDKDEEKEWQGVVDAHVRAVHGLAPTSEQDINVGDGNGSSKGKRRRITTDSGGRPSR